MIYDNEDVITKFTEKDNWSGYLYKIYTKNNKKYLNLIALFTRKADGRHPYLLWCWKDFQWNENCDDDPYEDTLENLLQFDIMYQIDKRMRLNDFNYIVFNTPEDSLGQINELIEEYGGQVSRLKLMDVTIDTQDGLYFD